MDKKESHLQCRLPVSHQDMPSSWVPPNRALWKLHPAYQEQPRSDLSPQWRGTLLPSPKKWEIPVGAGVGYGP